MTTANERYLQVQQVNKVFTRDNVSNQVLADLNLTVKRAEYISIIGHSGCGRSTLLNILAGLSTATDRYVILDCKVVNAPCPDRGLVLLNHSLLPWRAVYENVALAVNIVCQHKNKKERHEWILHHLNRVGMSHAIDRRPGEISGG